MPELTVTNLTARSVATTGSFGQLRPYETRTRNQTVSEIEQLRPALIALQANGIVDWDVGGYDRTDPDAEFVTFEDASAAGGGAGTGGGPSIVVGNSLFGDTLDDCDFLDPGDGTGIQAAMAAVPGFGATVYIKRGIYDLGLSSVSPISVPRSTVVQGEGQRNTTIRSSPTQRTVFDFTLETSIRGLRLDIPPAAVGAVGFYLLDISSADEFVLQDVLITVNSYNANESMINLMESFLTLDNSFRNCFINFQPGWPAGFVPMNLFCDGIIVRDFQVITNSGMTVFSVIGVDNNFDNVFGSCGQLIQLSASSRTTISNLKADVSVRGVSLSSSTNCIVKSCVFTASGTPTNGIAVQGGGRNIVNSCVLFGAFPDSIFVDAASVRNVIDSCVAQGYTSLAVNNQSGTTVVGDLST